MPVKRLLLLVSAWALLGPLLGAAVPKGHGPQVLHISVCQCAAEGHVATNLLRGAGVRAEGGGMGVGASRPSGRGQESGENG